MNKMMPSMKALNNEKDPAKLRDLLKEHSALVDQMHAKMMGEGTIIQNMATHMKNCPIVSSNTGETANLIRSSSSAFPSPLDLADSSGLYRRTNE
jgi:hypothetical protein